MGGITTSNKKDGANGIGVYLGCAVMGVAALKFGSKDVSWIGYGLTGLGGITAMADVVRNTNPYRKLFENAKLEIGGQIPRFIRKRKTDYGYCLTFSLPYGMSTDDFRKKQLPIEQYLNKKVDISYDNYRVFLKVYEKEIESSPPYEFVECEGKVEFPIGVILGGRIITIDMEKVVHLLIAGETGSGKSTLLRAIITNLILSKKKVGLHLIDLKNGAEFAVFRKSNKVKSFSRTKEEAEIILSKMLAEVDRRYDLFYENDVVDIGEYNKLKGLSKLDYQVVIVDEFADLQTEKGSISAIETLAAKARACGIPLIISTQRPDKDILNGRIKANVPGVVGLKVKNELNSRIIIGEGGLEKLRGLGNGIFKFTTNTEFQSTYITNSQARELIKHTYREKPIKLNKPKEEKIKVAEIKDFSFLKKLG